LEAWNPLFVMELLKLDHVSKSFDAIKVADDVCVSLRRGEAVGVIGPNGAGKSSLFNLISGSIDADQGSIRFDGREINGASQEQRCRAGIGRTYQIPQPFAKMTVFENLLTAAAFGGRMSERQSYRPCVDILERVGLMAKANTLAGGLTLLERKRLEVARALASAPKLLLLDEIAGGLTEREAMDVARMISELHAGGVTILWIEHVVNALVRVVDRLLVINFGAIVLDGNPTAVMASADVKRIYMGSRA
jgi:branched-chain amino acid transport system ATP-binding protein